MSDFQQMKQRNRRSTNWRHQNQGIRKFKYLISVLTEDEKCATETQSCTGLAKMPSKI